jgi:hypothetical protein
MWHGALMARDGPKIEGATPKKLGAKAGKAPIGAFR